MNTDTKLLKAKTEDLFTLCSRHCEPKFSQFLDGGEIAVLEDEFHMPYGYNTMFWGGYDGAERRILGVFPDWQEAKRTLFPMCTLRFDAPKFRALAHRDYLGTLMSIGLDRSKIGDILTDEEGAHVFVCADIAEYVVNNVTKIANAGVKVHIVDIGEDANPTVNTKQETCICASLRLDAVVAAAFNISRAAAENLIKEGYVKVNHRETPDRSKQVEVGSLLSVRNYGRFILKDTGNNTRKGRLHITVEKFV